MDSKKKRTEESKLLEERQRKEKRKKLEDILGNLQEFQYQFDIENFQQLVVLNWSTNPIYTSKPGYRLAVNIDRSICFQTGERGLKIEFHIIEGEFDSVLQWPLHVKIAYELLNSQNDVLYEREWTGWFMRVGDIRPELVRPFSMDDVMDMSDFLPLMTDGTLRFKIKTIKLL